MEYDQPMTLDLEIKEIERRERAGGSCTSSSTSRHCTCACFITTGESRPRSLARPIS